MASSSDRPVRDSGIAPVPREAPYRAGGKHQGNLSSRKADLLHTGTIGHVPGYDDSPKLADMYVQDRVPYKRPGYKSGASQAGPRPLPRDVEVYRTDAPGGGSFVRHLDGHTTHERDRPGLVEYHNSPDPEDDADERADVAAEISNRDANWGHRYW